MENQSKPSSLSETLYQKLAREYCVTTKYVGKIFRGERLPVRGRGLKVKKAIDDIIKNKV